MTITALDDDEWSMHVASGEAYAGEILRLGVGGEYPHAQLFNPVGSGLRVRLRSMQPMAIFGIAINTNMRRHDVALTTLGAFAGPANLLGGGAAPVAELRHETNVALLGSPFWLILSAGQTRSDYPVKHLDWGYDLLPGQGFVQSGIVGGFLLSGFIWAEVPL